MNGWLGMMHHPAVERLGWVLLHSLWQGALIGVVFGLVRHGLRRRSAEARYAAGCLALGLLVAAPVVTLTWWSETTAVEGGWSPEGMVIRGARLDAANGARSPVGEGAWSLVQLGTGMCGRLAPLLAAAWIVGVVFCLVRLVRGCWWVRQMRTRRTEAGEPGWLEMLDDLRCRLQISRPVCLLKSALVEVPTVVGWLRPVILVPISGLTGLTPEQIQAILAHELAHVRRFDYLVNACQLAMETLMFYHPVTWWISRCVREEREHCCDDLVVRVCGDRLAYARALTALEEWRPGRPALAFAASGTPLLNRIRRLLGVTGENRAASVRHMGGLTLLSIGLPLALVGVYLLFSSAGYQATARVLMNPNAFAQAEPSPVKAGPDIYDPYYLQTELEIMQSEAVLGRVVDRLRLNEAWSRRNHRGKQLTTQQSVALLKTRLRLHPHHSKSVDISALSEEPKEAAELANTVVEAYRNYRAEGRSRLVESELRVLSEERRKAEDEAVRVGADVERLHKELSRHRSAAAGNTAGPAVSAETLRHVNQLRIEAEAELIWQTTLLTNLQKLDREKLIQTLPTAAQDNWLASLLEQKVLAEQTLVAAQRNYGPQHPEVVKAQSLVTDLQEKIMKRTEGILTGMRAKAESLGRSLTNLIAVANQARQEEGDLAQRNPTYLEAKHRQEDLQNFLRGLDTRIASEKVNATLPVFAVEFLNPATAPEHPVTPNRFLASVLISSGLLLDLLGILLVRAGRRIGG